MAGWRASVLNAREWDARRSGTPGKLDARVAGRSCSGTPVKRDAPWFSRGYRTASAYTLPLTSVVAGGRPNSGRCTVCANSTPAKVTAPPSK